jgi:hypothetical protein
MIRRYLYGLIALSIMSCTKHEVYSPAVDVSVKADTYKVNENVEFFFNGEADIITFYSGEEGKEYQYKDRTQLEGGDLNITMDTQVLYGSQNNLKLFISQDFDGNYTAGGIDAATWVDISDRLTWSTAASGAVGVRVKSNQASIQELLKPGKPVYFGFRYLGLASTTGAAQQRTWRVYEFDVVNKIKNKEFVVTNRAGAGWTAVNYSNSVKGFWALTQNATMIYYSTESNLEGVEKWAITKALDIDSATPDVGVAIKSYPDNMVKSFSHAFTQPGTYNVTFVFTNSNFNGIKEVMKTVTVTIEP